MARLARWVVVGLLLVAGCVAVPGPLPEPPTFRSILAVPEPQVKYFPLVSGPNAQLGRGVAATYTDVHDGCADARRVGAAWLYDWTSNPPQCDGIPSLPMVWPNSKTCPPLGPGSIVLGFNEPDRPDQTNLTPDQAAVLWRRVTLECYPERTFATPATIMTEGYSGLHWMDDWVAAWQRRYGETLPPARYLAVHCYSWTTGAACIERLKQAELWARNHGLAGMIVSEWAVLPCAIGQAAALRESELVRAWLEGNPYVLGHAWFATLIKGDEVWGFKPHEQCRTDLVDVRSERLTAFGEWYRGR